MLIKKKKAATDFVIRRDQGNHQKKKECLELNLLILKIYVSPRSQVRHLGQKFS